MHWSFWIVNFEKRHQVFFIVDWLLIINMHLYQILLHWIVNKLCLHALCIEPKQRGSVWYVLMAVLFIQHIILMSVTPTTFWGGQSSVITEPLLLVVPNLKLVSRALCWPQPCKHLSHWLLLSQTCTRNFTKQLWSLTFLLFKHNFLIFFKKKKKDILNPWSGKTHNQIHFWKELLSALAVVQCQPLIKALGQKSDLNLILLLFTVVQKRIFIRKFNILFWSKSVTTYFRLWEGIWI